MQVQYSVRTTYLLLDLVLGSYVRSAVRTYVRWLAGWARVVSAAAVGSRARGRRQEQQIRWVLQQHHQPAP